ncbi:hypothetical protein AAMO2058_000043800 [Amorphochlora amoebiformis]
MSSLLRNARSGRLIREFKERVGMEIRSQKPLISIQEQKKALIALEDLLIERKLKSRTSDLKFDKLDNKTRQSKLGNSLGTVEVINNQLKKEGFNSGQICRIMNCLLGLGIVSKFPDTIDRGGFKKPATFTLLDIKNPNTPVKRLIKSKVGNIDSLIMLIQKMRDPINGLKFRSTRLGKSGGVTGKEIIRWLSTYFSATPMEALQIGRFLVSKGILVNLYGKSTICKKGGKYIFRLSSKAPRPTLRDSILQMKQKRFGVYRWIQVYCVLEPLYFLVYKKKEGEILCHYKTKDIGRICLSVGPRVRFKRFFDIFLIQDGGNISERPSASFKTTSPMDAKRWVQVVSANLINQNMRSLRSMVITKRRKSLVGSTRGPFPKRRSSRGVLMGGQLRKPSIPPAEKESSSSDEALDVDEAIRLHNVNTYRGARRASVRLPNKPLDRKNLRQIKERKRKKKGRARDDDDVKTYLLNTKLKRLFWNHCVPEARSREYKEFSGILWKNTAIVTKLVEEGMKFYETGYTACPTNSTEFRFLRKNARVFNGRKDVRILSYPAHFEGLGLCDLSDFVSKYRIDFKQPVTLFIGVHLESQDSKQLLRKKMKGLNKGCSSVFAATSELIVLSTKVRANHNIKSNRRMGLRIFKSVLPNSTFRIDLREAGISRGAIGIVMYTAYSLKKHHLFRKLRDPNSFNVETLLSKELNRHKSSKLGQLIMRFVGVENFLSILPTSTQRNVETKSWKKSMSFLISMGVAKDDRKDKKSQTQIPAVNTIHRDRNISEQIFKAFGDIVLQECVGKGKFGMRIAYGLGTLMTTPFQHIHSAPLVSRWSMMGKKILHPALWECMLNAITDTPLKLRVELISELSFLTHSEGNLRRIMKSYPKYWQRSIVTIFPLGDEIKKSGILGKTLSNSPDNLNSTLPTRRMSISMVSHTRRGRTFLGSRMLVPSTQYDRVNSCIKHTMLILVKGLVESLRTRDTFYEDNMHTLHLIQKKYSQPKLALYMSRILLSSLVHSVREIKDLSGVHGVQITAWRNLLSLKRLIFEYVFHFPVRQKFPKSIYSSGSLYPPRRDSSQQVDMVGHLQQKIQEEVSLRIAAEEARDKAEAACMKLQAKLEDVNRKIRIANKKWRALQEQSNLDKMRYKSEATFISQISNEQNFCKESLSSSSQSIEDRDKFNKVHSKRPRIKSLSLHSLPNPNSFQTRHRATSTPTTVTNRVKTVTGVEKTVTDVEKPVTHGEKTVTQGERVVTQEEENVTDKEENVTDLPFSETEEKVAAENSLQKKAVTGEGKVVTGEEKAVTGEEKAVTGEEKAVTGEEKVVTGEEKAVTGECSEGKERKGLKGEDKSEMEMSSNVESERRNQPNVRRKQRLKSRESAGANKYLSKSSNLFAISDSSIQINTSNFIDWCLIQGLSPTQNSRKGYLKWRKSSNLTSPRPKPEPKPKSSEPKPKSSEPKTKSSDPKTKSSEPKTKSPEPKTKSSEPKTKPPEPRTKPSEPRTKPSEPRTKPSEPKSMLSESTGKLRESKLPEATTLDFTSSESKSAETSAHNCNRSLSRLLRPSRRRSLTTVFQNSANSPNDFRSSSPKERSPERVIGASITNAHDAKIHSGMNLGEVVNTSKRDGVNTGVVVNPFMFHNINQKTSRQRKSNECKEADKINLLSPVEFEKVYLSGPQRAEQGLLSSFGSKQIQELPRFGDISSHGMHMGEDDKTLLDITLVQKAVKLFQKSGRGIRNIVESKSMMNNPNGYGTPISDIQKILIDINETTNDLIECEAFMVSVQKSLLTSIGGYPLQHIANVIEAFVCCESAADRSRFVERDLNNLMNMKNLYLDLPPAKNRS